MKALQGKKPGLRSLWGKALVVFCLAALVFSGCSDGDGDNAGGGTLQRGKQVLRIEVLKGPDNPSLEGRRVDLRGIKVLITYTDGSWEETTDYTRFYTVPDSNARANFQSASGNVGANTLVISKNNVRAPINVGTPTGKGVYQIYPVNAYGNQGSSGYEPAYWSMALSQDYPFAEYRVVDYFLAYNPTNKEVKYAPLRIPGVMDAKEIDFFGGLTPKSTYFIDDVIDLTGFQMEIRYNDRKGLFITDWNPVAQGMEAQAQIGRGDGDTLQSSRVPYDARWDWSLNEALLSMKKPFLRINIGNRLYYGGQDANVPSGGVFPSASDSTPLTDPEYEWNWRVVYHDHILDELYTVKYLEVDPEKQPAFLTETNKDNFFYNDHVFDSGNKTLREEWLNRYLKDTEIIVHYNGTEATKRIVSRTSGRENVLPMSEYFYGNINWVYLANGRILTDVNGGSQYGTLSGPPLRGDVDFVYGEGDEDSNPFHNRLVFIHQNVARRGAVRNSEQLAGSDNAWDIGSLTAWEFNRNPDNVRTIDIGPVDVYILQDGDGALEITGKMDYPISPDQDRGSYEKLMDGLTFTTKWTNKAGTTVDRELKKDDPRLTIVGSTRPVIVDNKLYTAGTGVHAIGFWSTTEDEAKDITFRFRPWPSADGIEKEISLDIYNPATRAPK